MFLSGLLKVTNGRVLWYILLLLQTNFSSTPHGSSEWRTHGKCHPATFILIFLMWALTHPGMQLFDIAINYYGYSISPPMLHNII